MLSMPASAPVPSSSCDRTCIEACIASGAEYTIVASRSSLSPKGSWKERIAGRAWFCVLSYRFRKRQTMTLNREKQNPRCSQAYTTSFGALRCSLRITADNRLRKRVRGTSTSSSYFTFTGLSNIFWSCSRDKHDNHRRLECLIDQNSQHVAFQ